MLRGAASVCNEKGALLRMTAWYRLTLDFMIQAGKKLSYSAEAQTLNNLGAVQKLSNQLRGHPQRRIHLIAAEVLEEPAFVASNSLGTCRFPRFND